MRVFSYSVMILMGLFRTEVFAIQTLGDETIFRRIEEIDRRIETLTFKLLSPLEMDQAEMEGKLETKVEAELEVALMEFEDLGDDSYQDLVPKGSLEAIAENNSERLKRANVVEVVDIKELKIGNVAEVVELPKVIEEKTEAALVNIVEPEMTEQIEIAEEVKVEATVEVFKLPKNEVVERFEEIKEAKEFATEISEIKMTEPEKQLSEPKEQTKNKRNRALTVFKRERSTPEKDSIQLN